MSSTLIDAQHVGRRFGDRIILDAIDLRVATADRIALVGDNGSGKSTLLALLAGRDRPDRGTVDHHGTVAYLPQLGRSLDEQRTVREAALDALGVAEATRALEHAERWLGDDPIAEHAAALERWLAVGGDTVAADLAAGADRVGLPADLLDRPLAALSSGQGVRAVLLPLAARRHDALLLDEPTNHLDRDGRRLLERLLAEHHGALVVASHDRRFLEAHANRIVELSPRGGAATAYAGGWEAYEREQAAARHGAEVAFEQATAKRDHLIEAEREIRRRAAATRGRLGRPRDGDKHVKEWFGMRADGVEARGAMVGGRAARVEIPDKPWQERTLALELTPAEQRSPYVVALEGARVRRGDWLSPAFDLAVAHGERILLRGANGSGKSTLLGALAGTLPLCKGARTCGPQAVVSVLGAVEDALRSEATVARVVRALTGLEPAEARGRLAHVGLTAELAGRPASTLSPGERTRAELAVLGAQRTTCLLLDEPSIHLDLRALAAVEAALDGWPGALVVATHDERFAERLNATREVVL